MKTLLFAALISCLCALFVIPRVFCQNHSYVSALNSGAALYLIPEHEFLLPPNKEKKFRNEISTKALRKFNRDFKRATNVRWVAAPDGGYTAEFTSDSKQVTVAYNGRGLWTYILRRYRENRMLPAMRALVKSTFFDYNISKVTEIELPQENGNIIYNVMINNADGFKILQIYNMELEVISEFTTPERAD